MSTALRYCTLQDRVCIDAAGPDAVEFLRGQLTNDPPVGHEDVVSAAWSDARGRVRALFHVLRKGDGCVLVAERETVDAVLAAMRMFVLRAKVELGVDDDWSVAAILGDSVSWTKGRGDDDVRWLRVGSELVYAVGPARAVQRNVRGLDEVPERNVELAEIRLGLPRIGTATMLRYVPQMLNLDRLGAVSFTKGCYPGQEVVARLHHRGAVKRRMQRFRFELDTTRALPRPGDEILRTGTETGDEVVGEVVRAASADARAELLAVVQLDAVGAPLALVGDESIPLHHEPLPYDERLP
jgi:tRNA-modifying protein YgfZ